MLTQCLERKVDQRCRQVVAWRNRDKLATAWLHCLPGPEGMSNPVFSEALALALCMPSPACRSRVGLPLGGRGSPVVDIYGDRVQCATMSGDHWRTRHDNVKMALAALFAWAKVSHTTEVFGLFAPLHHGHHAAGAFVQSMIPPNLVWISRETKKIIGLQICALK